MTKALDLVIVMLFICFILFIALAIAYTFFDAGYRRWKQILRDEEERDAVHDRIINPEKYQK